MKIVGGLTSKKLAKSVANILNAEYIIPFFKRFPDTEFYLRFKKGFNEKTVVIHTLFPPNDSLVILSLLLNALKHMNVKSVTCVIPYFAYARQHRMFLTNECISAEAVAKIIETYGIVKKVITVNVHSNEVGKYFKASEFINLSAFEDILKYFKFSKFVLLPDNERERVEEIKKLADKYSFEFSYLIKERDRKTHKIKTWIENDIGVKNREVLIIDDIISSGSTMINAIKIAKKFGAKRINVACVHGIFAKNSDSKIKRFKIVKKVVCTDSIENIYSKISIADLIAKNLG